MKGPEPTSRSSPLPHGDRLLNRLAAEDAPIVLLWALPGSGRRRFLRSLVERSDGALRSLTRGDASADDRLDRALTDARRSSASGWVCEGWSPGRLGPLLDRLQVGERIVASVDRLPDLSPAQRSAVVISGPAEWLLERQEVASCRGAEGLEERALDAVFELTGGWLRPVELALEAGEELRIERPTDWEPMRRFLVDRVLASLEESDRSSLLENERTGAVTGLWREIARRERAPRQLLASAARAEQLRPRLDRRSRGTMPAFEVRLLGPPEVAPEGADSPLPWPYRRVVSLLALLLLDPAGSLPQERLLDSLWPDQSLDKARANLNPAVSHLRRWLSLGERAKPSASCVLVSNGVYRLNPAWRWRLDVEEFERVTARQLPRSATAREGHEKEDVRPDDVESRLAELERGRRLYRGPLLEGFRGRWMEERRRGLGASHRLLLRELGDLYARIGRLADAEDSYRSLLAVEPLEEEVHVAIMALYARQGREDLVRRQYEKLAAMLARELGIHPMDETIREVQRLLGR